MRWRAVGHGAVFIDCRLVALMRGPETNLNPGIFRVWAAPVARETLPKGGATLWQGLAPRVPPDSTNLGFTVWFSRPPLVPSPRAGECVHRLQAVVL